jgi:hypothetical protein
MDKTSRKMRVVTPDREKLAKRLLKSEAGWDGKRPIPVKWLGAAGADDLGGIELVHVSGDDCCLWVADPISAMVIFLKGHDLEHDSGVLAKRKTFMNSGSPEK